MPYTAFQDAAITIGPANPTYTSPMFSAPNLNANESPVLIFQMNPDLDAAGQAELAVDLNGNRILDVTFNNPPSTPSRAWEEIVASNVLTAANNQLVATAISGGFTLSDFVILYKF